MPLVLTSPGPSAYPVAIQVTEAAEAVPNKRLAARRSRSRLESDFIHNVRAEVAPDTMRGRDFAVVASALFCKYYFVMSAKIIVLARVASTRANGVLPSVDNDSRSALSFPAPEASTQ